MLLLNTVPTHRLLLSATALIPLLHICTACSVGYITQDLLAAHMPPPADSSLIMVCGPPPMMKAVSGDKLPDKSQGPLEGMLKGMGYTEGQVFKF